MLMQSLKKNDPFRFPVRHDAAYPKINVYIFLPLYTCLLIIYAALESYNYLNDRFLFQSQQRPVDLTELCASDAGVLADTTRIETYDCMKPLLSLSTARKTLVTDLELWLETEETRSDWKPKSVIVSNWTNSDCGVQVPKEGSRQHFEFKNIPVKFAFDKALDSAFLYIRFPIPPGTSKEDFANAAASSTTVLNFWQLSNLDIHAQGRTPWKVPIEPGMVSAVYLENDMLVESDGSVVSRSDIGKEDIKVLYSRYEHLQTMKQDPFSAWGECTDLSSTAGFTSTPSWGSGSSLCDLPSNKRNFIRTGCYLDSIVFFRYNEFMRVSVRQDRLVDVIGSLGGGSALLLAALTYMSVFTQKALLHFSGGAKRRNDQEAELAALPAP